MGFLIGLLTAVMVLNCIILIFLVLIQLPKKEAGAGLAFGAGATDALFGAGSGTVLTKITKYAAAIFFVLAIILSLLRNSYYNRNLSRFQQNLGQANVPSNMVRPPATQPATNAVTTNLPATNAATLSAPLEATNAAATVTNATGTPK
jgi:preprotein translocase subunit SecG